MRVFTIKINARIFVISPLFAGYEYNLPFYYALALRANKHSISVCYKQEESKAKNGNLAVCSYLGTTSSQDIKKRVNDHYVSTGSFLNRNHRFGSRITIKGTDRSSRFLRWDIRTILADFLQSKVWIKPLFSV